MLSSFWIKEFEDLELSDERISKRVISLLSTMSHNPGSSINKICTTKKDSKAAYRLLDNDVFDVKELLSLHYEKTAQRCSEMKTVILVQDTTGFNFNQSSKKGMGRIGGKLGRNKVESSGLFCHNLLAFSKVGEPLGLFDQNIWARHKCVDRSFLTKTSIDKKESYRWVQSLDKSEYLENSDTHFIVVSDRESDMNAYIGSALEKGMDIVIRVKDQRKDFISGRNLKDLFKQSESNKEIKVLVENRSQLSSHRRKPVKVRYKKSAQPTVVSIKYKEIELKTESELSINKFTRVTAIQVQEINPLKDVKQVEWILVTSLPVNNAEDAEEVIEIYKKRWRIEVYHKSQKSSCKIEQSGLREKSRLERFIVLQSLISFGICRVKYLLESHPEEDAERFFEKDIVEIVSEVTYQKIKVHGRRVKVKEFIFMLANLEGYKKYDLRHPPGVILLGQAIRTLNTILNVYERTVKSKDVGKR